MSSKLFKAITMIPTKFLLKDLREVTEPENPEVLRYFYSLLSDMGLDSNIKLMGYTDKHSPLNGKCGSEKYIVITHRLLSMYVSKPHAVKSVIAHELTHLKHRDFGIKMVLLGYLYPFWPNLYLAQHICKELRAEIEGIAYAKLSDSEIEDAQTILAEANPKRDEKESYKGGYPSRKQVIEYTQKYKEFSEQVIDDILEKFCKVMNVWNKEIVIKIVKWYYFGK